MTINGYSYTSNVVKLLKHMGKLQGLQNGLKINFEGE